MNTLYTVLFYLALPFILIRLWWRGRYSPGYRQKVLQRLGYYNTKKLARNTLWLHAVSYGEAVAAEPLIVALLQCYPDHTMLVTTMTPTGAARIAQRFGDQVNHQYVPYDFPGAVERFFNYNKPCIALIMETELWPNLIKACARRETPLLLVNARLSERAYQGYRRLLSMTRPMLQRISIIAAQTEADALRFEKLGASPEQLSIVGNLKFEVPPRPDLWEAGVAWRKQVGERLMWIAASTHPGEEEQVLAAHRLILAQKPDTLLLLAPRHPERFDRVVDLCASSDFSVERYTVDEFPQEKTQVFVLDTMGQLPQFYCAADVAFVAGSLVPIGGHNIIEAATAKTAIVFGPHMYNFTTIAEQFKQAGACVSIEDSSTLALTILTLLDDADQRQALVQSALQLVEKNTGAIEKLLQHIKQLKSGEGNEKKS